MMFQKKVDRAMEWLKQKNNNQKDNNNPNKEWEEQENSSIELEKNDMLALVLSALAVFGPIFLVLVGIIVLLGKI